jgi:hypothetical protein
MYREPTSVARLALQSCKTLRRRHHQSSGSRVGNHLAIGEYRKIAESKPLTLQGSDYAHAVQEPEQGD